ncbi:Checkpoint protein HUS1 [Blattella germanica]|nr:Checkpoint protein HUS1 [Blattella germanica]
MTVGRPIVWTVLEQSHFFNEYSMAGVSEEQNEIYLEFEPDVMAKSLHSLKGNCAANSVKIKLTNKKSPCLTFEIMLISIHLPNLKLIRTVTERMKVLSQYIIVLANLEGALVLKVETPEATVSTHFKELIVETTPNETDDEGRDEYYSARVDIKKFVQFLNTDQVSPQKVVCNIVDDEMIVMFVVHQDVTLHYFLPVISL